MPISGRFNSCIERMGLTKNQIRDYKKYFKHDPEKGFSPKRNKEIIARTIKKNEILKKKKDAQWTNELRERTDAVASYFKHLQNKSTPIEKYFGKKYLTHLQGRKIVMKLKRLAGVNNSPIYQLEEIT